MAQEPDAQGPFSDPEERRVLFAALDSFHQYRKTAHYNVTHRRRQNFYALPTTQWQMLSGPPFNLLLTFDRVDDAIDANAEIALEMLNTALSSFGLDSNPPNSLEIPERSNSSNGNSEPQALVSWRDTAKPSDVDKARSTLRQLYRDWTYEGAHERKACYEPVISDVVKAFCCAPSKSDVKILVPGAGLGRLVFELCRRGYTVEGNEISYHQLIASNWVLNHTVPGRQFDLYPFALDFSNVVSREEQLKKVKVPDVHPGSALEDLFGRTEGNTAAAERMSMTAADFVVLYGDEVHQDMFDAVVTVYFMDTAPNLIRYIETIRNCLRDGGLWINLGPLLWHFADRAPSEEHHLQGPKIPREKTGIEEPGAFELTDEEVLMLVEKMGFDIEKHEIRNDGVGYIQNPESMLQNIYRTSHWIAKKRPKI